MDVLNSITLYQVLVAIALIGSAIAYIIKAFGPIAKFSKRMDAAEDDIKKLKNRKSEDSKDRVVTFKCLRTLVQDTNLQQEIDSRIYRIDEEEE